jgi:hypothetical protein
MRSFPEAWILQVPEKRCPTVSHLNSRVAHGGKPQTAMHVWSSRPRLEESALEARGLVLERSVDCMRNSLERFYAFNCPPSQSFSSCPFVIRRDSKSCFSRKFSSLLLRFSDHPITRSPDHPILITTNLHSSEKICGQFLVVAPLRCVLIV